jgi:hypothetical protein
MPRLLEAVFGRALSEPGARLQAIEKRVAETGEVLTEA